MSVIGPCVVFIFFQFVAWALWLADTTHEGPTARDPGLLGTLSRLCSWIACLVLIAGMARLVLKLWAARAQRRQLRIQ
jgi:hypothetical protein